MGSVASGKALEGPPQIHREQMLTLVGFTKHRYILQHILNSRLLIKPSTAKMLCKQLT